MSLWRTEIIHALARKDSKGFVARIILVCLHNGVNVKLMRYFISSYNGKQWSRGHVTAL